MNKTIYTKQDIVGWTAQRIVEIAHPPHKASKLYVTLQNGKVVRIANPANNYATKHQTIEEGDYHLTSETRMVTKVVKAGTFQKHYKAIKPDSKYQPIVKGLAYGSLATAVFACGYLTGL